MSFSKAAFLVSIFFSYSAMADVVCNSNVKCGAYFGQTHIKNNVGATVDKWGEVIVLKPGASAEEVRVIFAVTYMSGEQQRVELKMSFTDSTNFKISTTNGIGVGEGSCLAGSCQYQYKTLNGVATGTFLFEDQRLSRTQIQKDKDGSEYYITQILTQI